MESCGLKMRCSLAIALLVLVPVFSVAVIGCGQSTALTDGGPSDEDVVRQTLERESPIGGRTITQVQVLNKETKGNESHVRLEISFAAATDFMKNHMEPVTRTFISRFVKVDGKWVLRDLNLG